MKLSFLKEDSKSLALMVGPPFDVIDVVLHSWGRSKKKMLNRVEVTLSEFRS